MVRQYHQLNGHEFGQLCPPGNSGRQKCLLCCNPRFHKELDTTQQLNNREKGGVKVKDDMQAFGLIHQVDDNSNSGCLPSTFNFMYSFLVVLGLRCRVGFFSSCREHGYSLVGGHWLLIVVLLQLQGMGSRACRLQQLWHVSLVVAAPRLQRTGSTVVAHGLHCSAAHESSHTRD